MSEMTQEPNGRRTVIGMVVGIAAIAGAFGAGLGYVLPAYQGLEEVTVLSITFAVSPRTFAAYGAVAVGAFLVTLLLVIEAISRFDENAV